MQKLILGLTLFFVSGCLPSLSQRHIVVEAEATEEFVPEAFYVTGSVRARDRENLEVLKSLSSTLQSIRTRIVEVEGIEKVEILQDDLKVEPVYDRACDDGRNYRADMRCATSGYFGTVEISVRASPASVAGDVFSYLSELGVEEVEFSGFAVLNYEAAKQKALQSAVGKARKKADEIAAAAGSSVVKPIKIQVGSGFDENMFEDWFQSDDTIIVTGSRISRDELAAPSATLNTLPEVAGPTVRLTLDGRPISVKAEVVAAFEID